jgi:hypothetical protein
MIGHAGCLFGIGSNSTNNTAIFVGPLAPRHSGRALGVEPAPRHSGRALGVEPGGMIITGD